LHMKMLNLRVAGLLVLLAACSVTAAQTNYKSMQDAFDKSYKLEWKGNYTEAIAALRAVYAEDSYETNLRLGWLNYLAGSFTESTAYYQKAVSLKPYAIEAKFGSVYPASALGNWEQVMNTYGEILQIDPQNTLANYRVGMIWYGRKEYAKAEGYFEKVVNLYPFDFDSVVMYAWTFLREGKFREAQVLFNKALLIRPNDPSATEGLNSIK